VIRDGGGEVYNNIYHMLSSNCEWKHKEGTNEQQGGVRRGKGKTNDDVEGYSR